MKLIDHQSFELLGTPTTLEDSWRFAEKAYRVCYQSAPKDDLKTSEEFCRGFLKNSGDPEKDHLSPLGFGTVYLQGFFWNLKHYVTNKFSRFNRVGLTLYVTTNLRVIFENGWEHDLKYSVSPTDYHVPFYSFSIYTCIQVYKDCRTHTTLTWAVESSRYCNYSKDRFGSEISFMLLPRIRDKYPREVFCLDENNTVNYEKFLESNPPEELLYYIGGMKKSEECYLNLLTKFHWKTQEASQRLPQDTAAHAMFGGYPDSLDHFFNLRALGTTGSPHPLVKELMLNIYETYKLL